ncbi:MAG: xanthine dehydrogenase family protein molybdopterin-binding subunit [Sphaerochaeta sp.]|nr:xanthine dehydrogenase family protein molybdopterin-binding subunit [Sphaerochaeta sp.]
MREYTVVNKSLPRTDAHAKVTGSMLFGDDYNAYNQLYAKAVYTDHPYADIESVDVSAAMCLAGVVDVITASDIPHPIMFGRFPALAQDTALYIGDAFAVVAAETEEIASLAASMVTIRYKKIHSPLVSVQQALSSSPLHATTKGNYIDHASHHLELGSPRGAFADASVVIEQTYSTSFVDNGYIEPESVLVEYDPNTHVVVIRGTIQNPYNIRELVAGVLGYPLNRVRVIQTAIGGSFGGKDESMALISARAAVLAIRTGRPVKTTYTREESFVASAKRHPFTSSYKVGLSDSGKLLGLTSTHYALGGPYNKQAMFANWRASIHAAGPYSIEHVTTDVYGVHSNTIFGGAYRGFSAPQIQFGIESLIDECALSVDMDPITFRLLNCLKPGDIIPSGQILDPDYMPANLGSLIVMVSERTDFLVKWHANQKKQQDASSPLLQGIGISTTYRGVGLGGEGIDTGSATVTIDMDGFVQVTSGFTEMGQGLSTTLCQIVAQELGLEISAITWFANDTSANMDSGPTVASRGIVAGGNAVKDACNTLKTVMACTLAEHFGGQPEQYVFAHGLVGTLAFADAARFCLKSRGISLSAKGWYSPGPETFDPRTGQGKAYPSYLWGATVAQITVDMGTGVIKVDHLTSAIELGRAINPQIVRSQFIGGAIQGLGYAIMEEMDCHDGFMHTLNFDDFMMPSSMDIPEMDIILVETDENVGPYGAKGIGELGIEMIAPAIVNAYANATGKRVREIPLNLERVVLGHGL